jgi:beta-lactamase class A
MIYSLEGGVHGRYKSKCRLVFSGLILSFVGVGFFFVGSNQAAERSHPKPVSAVYSSPASSVTEAKAPIVLDRFNEVAIQAAVDAWSKKHPNASVAVSAEDGTVLATAKPDSTYHMASIYKLYTAYAGYQAIDAGLWNPSDPMLRTMTREKCLDEMIRTSDSACAEKILSDLGKANVQAKIQELGLKTTSVAGLTTSAQDAALMLQIIQRGEGLSPESKQKLMDSMQNQKYRNALVKGFAGLTVYNKVGFRDMAEYHDVAIIKLSDGTPIIVAVLTKNTGNRSIAQLANQLMQATQVPQAQ